MARPLTPPTGRAGQLALVFAGGIAGGAARIAVTALWPVLWPVTAQATSQSPVPWDIVLINVVGSTLLGALVAFSRARGGLPLLPLLGPGFLGGFTTFSALACLGIAADAPAWVAPTALAGTVVACVAGAALGWWWGDRPPTAVDSAAIFAEENE